MKHVYTENLDTPRFTVRVSPSTRYGYFERNTGGEGGLWFAPADDNPDVIELADYDGVFCLPREVGEVLRGAGYRVSDNCFADTPVDLKGGTF